MSNNTLKSKREQEVFIYIYYKVTCQNFPFGVFHLERLTTTLFDSTSWQHLDWSSFLFGRISEGNFFFKLSNQIVEQMNVVSRIQEECKTALWTKKESVWCVEILNTTSHSCWLQTSFLSLLGTIRSFYQCSLPYHRVVPSS